MRHRCSIPALAVAAFAVAMLAIPAAAQTAAKPTATKAAAVKSSTAIPHTADGHPDLSGVFSNSTTVPLARPANLGAKEFYTDEADRTASQARGGGNGGRGGGGGRGGAAARIDPETGQPALAVHYDNSQFGLGGGTEVRSTSLRTSIITGPEGRVPPLTAGAQKRQADTRAYNAVHQWDGPENRPLGEQCIMWPSEGPPMLAAGYNDDVQVVQGQGYVSILQEMIHDARIIPTDNRPHLSSDVHQWMGDARGHWEGDKLVVETTNFTNRTLIQQAPVTPELKVVEKFSRLDADHLKYEFTVDDPETWTKPWSGEVVWTKVNGPIYEYACNEGNYGMANNMSATRAQERAAQGKK